MNNQSSSQLLQLLTFDFEATIAKLIRKARMHPHWKFSIEECEDIACVAFEHILTQIYRGNLNKILEHPNPRLALLSILLNIGFREGVSKVVKAFKMAPSKNMEVATSDVWEENSDIDYSWIEKAIRQLPVNYQKVITQFYIEKKSIKVIAKHIDKSPDAVKVMLYRARKKLAELLESSLPG